VVVDLMPPLVAPHTGLRCDAHAIDGHLPPTTDWPHVQRHRVERSIQGPLLGDSEAATPESVHDRAGATFEMATGLGSLGGARVFCKGNGEVVCEGRCVNTRT
jgi:hypothetical protein